MGTTLSCDSCLLGIARISGCTSSQRELPCKRVEPEAIDTGLLRAWRHRVLGSLLPSSDEALLLDIAKYVDDPSPPAMATSSLSFGITMGLSRDSLRVPQSSNMALVAADSGGKMVVAAVQEPGDIILVWHFEAVGSLLSQIRPTILSRSLNNSRATSLWINTIANRLAVGGADGTVQIWSLDSGILRATCFAHILESTRWTTVGHTGEVCVIRDAPLAKCDNGWSGGCERAGGALVATGDNQGVVCLWTEDAHPISTMHASWFNSPGADARTTISSYHAIVDIATAPGLLICALPRAVIGLEAPGHAAIFVLSLECGSPYNMYRTRELLAVTCLASSSSEYKIIGFTADGTALSWEIEDSGARYTQYDSCFPHLKQAKLLASACTKRFERAAIAMSRGRHLCWLSPKQSGNTEIRWMEIDSDLRDPLVYQGCVRQHTPLNRAILLPRKLQIPMHKRVIVLPALCF